MNFAGLAPELTEVLAELGFTTMTPIQERALPHALAGRDVVGQARTGSGKTAAFALTLLQKLDVSRRVPQALVLCPTRELTAQVAREIRRFGRRLPGLQVLVAAGGEPARPQREALDRGVHVVVGTPGRLLDLAGNLETAFLTTLVLDEADRMLDMGFADDVRQIVGATPATRQTLLFSATYPPEIKSLARFCTSDPVNVAIKSAETSTLEHLYLSVERDEKPALLARVLRQCDGAAIVFCNFKAVVAEVNSLLEREGFAVACLHGDLEQRDRDRVLAMFRGGTKRVLIATDVAARGLDIEGLDLVVHYEAPHEASVYTHRSGRTGRAGRAGVVVALATYGEAERLHAFAELTKISLGDLRSRFPEPAKARDMRTLHISGGRKDKLRPGDILGAMTGAKAGLTGDRVGKIEIHDKISYVAVDAAEAEHAARCLRDGGIKGRRFLVRLVD